MKVIAVVLVAGKSTRFEGNISKQVFLLGGKPVFTYPVKTFCESKLIDKVIIATDSINKEQIEQFLVKEKYSNVEIVLGGDTRQESVEHALNSLKENDCNDIIIIHDGARPLIDESIISDVISAAKEYEAATTFIKVEDTIALSDSADKIVKFVDRTNLVRIQTPQAFKLGLLVDAHKKSANNNATDDCSLVMSSSHDVKLVEGSKKLTKITTIDDIKILENYIK